MLDKLINIISMILAVIITILIVIGIPFITYKGIKYIIKEITKEPVIQTCYWSYRNNNNELKQANTCKMTLSGVLYCGESNTLEVAYEAKKICE